MAERYELRRSKDGQYYFTLKADNNEPILVSETYPRKAGALKGMAAVMENADDADHYEVRQDREGHPYFVLRADNGEIVGKSEAYSNESALQKGIAAVKGSGPVAPLDDQT